MDGGTALFTVLIAMLGGAIRVTTPFLFVALGEMLTERSGRINLGLEGTLVLGAMTAYAFSFQTGSAWIGVLAAGCFGFLMGSLHATICRLPGVNDIAVGIALMLFGTGLAFFFGKPYIQPTAPRLPSIPLGDWTGMRRSRRRSTSIRCFSSAWRSRCSWPGGSRTRGWASSCA